MNSGQVRDRIRSEQWRLYTFVPCEPGGPNRRQCAATAARSGLWGQLSERQAVRKQSSRIDTAGSSRGDRDCSRRGGGSRSRLWPHGAGPATGHLGRTRFGSAAVLAHRPFCAGRVAYRCDREIGIPSALFLCGRMARGFGGQTLVGYAEEVPQHVKDSALGHRLPSWRPEGMALLMEDQNLASFYNRGRGSITGTSLGVESIGEFQTLPNTTKNLWPRGPTARRVLARKNLAPARFSGHNGTPAGARGGIRAG